MVERLGPWIKHIRQKLNLSQYAFAKDMNETRNRVVKVELGLMKTDVEFLAKLRKAYKVSLDKLFDKAEKDEND